MPLISLYVGGVHFNMKSNPNKLIYGVSLMRRSVGLCTLLGVLLSSAQAASRPAQDLQNEVENTFKANETSLKKFILHKFGNNAADAYNEQQRFDAIGEISKNFSDLSASFRGFHDKEELAALIDDANARGREIIRTCQGWIEHEFRWVNSGATEGTLEKEREQAAEIIKRVKDAEAEWRKLR